MTQFLTRHPATLLAEIAMHLYGSAEFSGPMADALNVGKRTAERWLSGTRGVPPFVWPIIVSLLREKHGQLEILADDLEERIAREDFPQRDPVEPEIDPTIREHWHDHTR